MPGSAMAFLLTGLALARATDPAEFDFCILTSPVDFANATAFCIEAGYDMVNPRSELENSRVAAACGIPGSDGCWLGLTDQSNGTDGEWFWADGTPLSYSNWAEIERWTGGGNGGFQTVVEGNGGPDQQHAIIYQSLHTFHGVMYMRSWFDTPGVNPRFAVCQAPQGSDASSRCSGIPGVQFVSAAEAAEEAARVAGWCGGEPKCVIAECDNPWCNTTDIADTSGCVILRRPALLGLTCVAALLLLLQ